MERLGTSRPEIALTCKSYIDEYVLIYRNQCNGEAEERRQTQRDPFSRHPGFRGAGTGCSDRSHHKCGREAEGSLFTYFKTKDELINALYRELKLELADAVMSSFPRKQSVRHRLEHVSNGYVQWGGARRFRGDDYGFYSAGAE